MQWKSLTPGLINLLAYERTWLKHDVRAGLSVAAVALPVAIAYAELAGVSAIVGLYSCILPMGAYAIFGSSRQLIVGPDAATCAVIAAVITPLAEGNAELHWQLAIALVVVLLSEPLQYIPIAVLGVILIYALWGLLDLRSIFQLCKRNRPAFYLALFTFLSVLLVGIIPGIGLAVLLGLLQFL